MSQNIYDQPGFFEAYMGAYDRSNADLDRDPAWNLDVLDLGCGSGWFARWAVDQGARFVLALDLSENMLREARKRSAEEHYRVIEYKRADLDALEPITDATAVAVAATGATSPDDACRFGLVFSSLALHYLVNLSDLLAEVHRVLKPGCLFVFNVEHPIYTAPSNQTILSGPSGLGDDDTTTTRYWAFNNYYKD